MIEDVKPWEWDWTAIMALVAASVALYGAWRANKIAEKNLSASIELQLIQFREKWIGELREELVGFAAAATNPIMDSKNKLTKLSGHLHKVTLLMNQDDPLFSSLNVQMLCWIQRAIYNHDRLTDDTLKDPSQAFLESPKEYYFLDKSAYSVSKFEDIASQVLKSEW